MFAEMRTGSNLLEANLNALPGVTCHGEAFNPHFIGKKDRLDLFGVSIDAREADPMALISAMRAQTEGLSGFRYFHDHDARVYDLVMNDPGCAKIILTRNPLESYVSWKIAQATGQWKLTNAKNLKTAQASFDEAEFLRHIADLQEFQVRLLHSLQVSGQTAFYIDYDDVQDLAVINGLAAFLGVDARLPALDGELKKQNPEEISEKVSNPEQMAAALGRIDRFNLSRTPNFEPRRGPNLISLVAATGAPLLYMPVKGGPEAQVNAWLAAFGGGVERSFDQKALRIWRRTHPRHRSFTVLRHPLLRAHAVFCEALHRARPEARQVLHRAFATKLPDPAEGYADADAFREGFKGFLRFLKAATSGQSSLKVEPQWASQTAVVQGMALLQAPDALLREDSLAEGLAWIAMQVGAEPPELDEDPAEAPFSLAEIYGPDLEAAARDAYARDYLGFGFTDWRG